MQGRGFDFDDHSDQENRGLQPRVFDYLFAKTRADISQGECEHLLKCSYFEIYNEQIMDLVTINR